MAQNVLVSVLVAAYNAETYIKEAIEGILNQTYSHFELIIVDDGSTDKTVTIIKSFSDSRIKIYSNGENKGLTYTRLRLFSLSKGDYLAVNDADDVSFETRLEEEVSFLEQNQQYGMAASWVHYFGKSESDVKYIFSPEELKVEMLFLNCICISGTMIRKTALPAEYFNINYKYTELYGAEDFDIWIKMFNKWKGIFIRKTLINYRIHSNNMSIAKLDLLEQGEKKVLADHFELIGLKWSSQRKEDFHELIYKQRNTQKDFYKIAALFEIIISSNINTNYFSQTVLIKRIGSFEKKLFDKWFILNHPYHFKKLFSFLKYYKKAHFSYPFFLVVKFILKSIFLISPRKRSYR